jgi:hypothetical protein
MNYVQIPEETAKILHRLAISSAAKVADHDAAERAIVACGVLTQALSEAKPLPKKPGPKSKLKQWDSLQLPQCEVGNKIKWHDGTIREIVSIEDNGHGGQSITYMEVEK